MYRGQTVALLIPARNEALTLPAVLKKVPGWVDRVLVVDNGSSDETAELARCGGAEVVFEPRPGYGRACLSGLARLSTSPPALVAFADADGSDDLSRLELLLQPLAEATADFCLVHRRPTEIRALTPQQRFGNWLATRLVGFIWGYRYRDLGPMRALCWPTLNSLGMADENYGWTVEMQIRALQAGLRIREVPLPYRPRLAGRSQISGTVRGVIGAGGKILWVIAREAWRERRRKGREKNPLSLADG